MYRHILVAVDGLKASEKAVKIAKEDQVESFTITHVVDRPNYSMYDLYSVEKEQEYADQLLHEFVEKAKTKGSENVNKVVQFGSPKVTIAKTIASDVNADLIVCGATGINAVDRIFIGSVSEHTTRYAKCDVFIVRND